MAKYFGKIGYMTTAETAPSVWTEKIIERESYGEVIKNTKRFVNGEHLHDDLTISNQLSILADPYAFQNFHTIRYATYMGVKWKVESVDVEYPRLILALGGVYNEE